MKKIIYSSLILLSFVTCKRNYDATPTYAGTGIAITWVKSEPFYTPNPQIFLENTSPGTWRNFTSFPVTSAAEPDKIGFANPYLAGKGTNALYMNTLYASQPLTSDSGYYNVTIPKCFQFIPKSATETSTGKVVVIPQLVKIYRRDKTSFNIGIGPSTQSGTYSTVTGLLEIEVQFDETSIGGASDVKRKYRFTP
jgi:hypothetical protein